MAAVQACGILRGALCHQRERPVLLPSPSLPHHAAAHVPSPMLVAVRTAGACPHHAHDASDRAHCQQVGDILLRVC